MTPRVWANRDCGFRRNDTRGLGFYSNNIAFFLNF
jgi:hypothetical protein